jgi:hypothetical protein
MAVSISRSLCAEIPQTNNIREIKNGNRENIAGDMPEKWYRTNKSRGLSGSYPYVGEHTAEAERVEIYGNTER